MLFKMRDKFIQDIIKLSDLAETKSNIYWTVHCIILYITSIVMPLMISNSESAQFAFCWNCRISDCSSSSKTISRSESFSSSNLSISAEVPGTVNWKLHTYHMARASRSIAATLWMDCSSIFSILNALSLSWGNGSWTAMTDWPLVKNSGVEYEEDTKNPIRKQYF